MSSSDDNKIVSLSVGGRQFESSAQTLCRVENSYFCCLLSAPWKKDSERENERSIFIDRDGTYFDYILNFLRDGAAVVLPEAGAEPLKRLKQEAQYYGLSQLVDLIESRLEYSSITFAIGSSEFTALRNVWMRSEHSLFAQILRGEADAPLDHEGRYRIARDGSSFEHILRFLEHTDPSEAVADLTKICRSTYWRILSDADYYNLKELKELLKTIEIVKRTCDEMLTAECWKRLVKKPLNF